MADLPREKLPLIKSVNKKNDSMWSVIVYYVNSDMIDKEKPNQPHGLVIPCGQYNTREEAEKLRDNISLKTGVTFACVCKNNEAMRIGVYDPKNTILYRRSDTDSIEQIEESIYKAKEDKARVDEQLKQEVIERSDKETLSYMISKLHLVSNAKRVEEETRKQIEQSKIIFERNLELVKKYFTDHPDRIKTWKQQARPRFVDRLEVTLYDSLCSTFDDYVAPSLGQDVPNEDES